jgi:hypothetical protein
VKVRLPEELPPLRMLVVLDNLSGHKSAELLLWMFARGIMVLYTPLGASWLNMRPSRCSESLPGGHWRGTTQSSQRRSSNGWKRRLEDGTKIRRRLSGVAIGRHDESVLVGDGTLWEGAELAHGGRSGDAGPSWRNGDTRVN